MLKLPFEKSIRASTYEISHKQTPVLFCALSLVSVIPFLIKLFGFTLNMLIYGYSATSYDYIHFLASAFLIISLTLFPNNLEFLAIPIFIFSLNSIIGFSGNINSIIGLLLSVALLGTVIGFTFGKTAHKWLKISAIVYVVVNLILTAINLTIVFIDGNTPVLSSYLFSISTYLIISLPIAFSKECVNSSLVEIPRIRLIIGGVILIICILLIIVFPLIDYDGLSDSSPSCGHPACAENGPFPCYGKNNTCPNYTDCYQDLYCNQCD